MKNIFGMNLDKDELDAKKIILRETDEGLSKQQDDMGEDLERYAKKATLSGPLSVLLYISGLLTALCLYITFAPDEPLWWFLLPAGVFGIITAALAVCGHVRRNRVMNSDEFQTALKRSEHISEEARICLGVPADAADIDVFGCAYKIKKGQMKQGIPGCEFINFSMWMFVEKDQLCIADTEAVYAIPLSSIMRVVRMERKITFDDWNKDAPYHKEPYKAFKISKNNNTDILSMRSYCSVQFLLDGEEHELVIPTYDIESVLRATGFSLTEVV